MKLYSLSAIIFISAVPFFAKAQLSPNNLVVTEIADETKTGTTLYLTEYDLNGNKISTMPIGSSDFFVSGSLYSTPSNVDGMLSLSDDGKLLTVYGYNKTSVDDKSPNSNTDLQNNRTLAVINANKEQAIIPVPGIHSGNAARTAFAVALSAGKYGVYLSGAGTGGSSGLQYVIFDQNSGTAGAPVSITNVNSKTIRVFNDQLYISSGFKDTRLLKVGAGIPDVSKQVAENLPGNDIAALTAPNDFVMFGNNLLYITEEYPVNGGIKKFYFDGTEWKLMGIIDSGIANDGGFTGLTGRLEDGVVTLYGITSSNINNSIIKITDNSGAANVTDRCTPGVSVSVLARAAAGTGFRGIAFTPQSAITLPVSLSSFTAKAANGKPVLNWVTSFEQFNSYFDILRAGDDKQFVKIGQVTAKSNPAGNQYTYTDNNPLNGINYYQLKQVDENGNFKLYGPAAVSLSLKDLDCIISATNNSVEIRMYNYPREENCRVEIYNTSGGKLAEADISLSKGFNLISVPVRLQTGIYIIRIQSRSETFTKKLLKQ